MTPFMCPKNVLNLGPTKHTSSELLTFFCSLFFFDGSKQVHTSPEMMTSTELRIHMYDNMQHHTNYTLLFHTFFYQPATVTGNTFFF